MNIVDFPKQDTGMTPEEALKKAAEQDLQEILIVGYNSDEDLVVIASRLTKRDVLWIIRSLELHLFTSPLE